MNIRTKLNLIIVGLFLAGCIYVVYFLPTAKYAGKAITARVLESIPVNTHRWQGRDIEDIGDNMDGQIYNFISRILARQYTNSSNSEERLFLVALDAGNFHYPKVCFKGAGFSTEELPQRDITVAKNRIKAHLMLSSKEDEQLLSLYWICIDKKIVSTWAQQKIKQLFYSLFNKKRVGLMVRVDIPVTEGIDKSVETVEGFLKELYQAAPQEYRDYIFSN